MGDRLRQDARRFVRVAGKAAGDEIGSRGQRDDTTPEEQQENFGASATPGGKSRFVFFRGI